MDSAMDIDVNALFPEENLNQTSLGHDILLPENTVLPSAAAVLPPGLTEHITSLSYPGPSVRLAWSRQGHIARIVNDGTAVELTCQRYNCRANEWQLSESKLLEATFDTAVTLAWSPTGVDLAVADNQGRFQLFSMTTTCLNRLHEARSYLLDAPSESARPIGLYWLSQDRHEKPKMVLQETVKTDNKWTNVLVRAKGLPPIYPRAFLNTNQSGIITLLYQRPDGHYQTTSTRLPIPLATILTHAAFSPTAAGKVLVVTSSSEGILDAFHVDILWRGEQTSNTNGEVKPVLKISIIDSHLPALPSFIESSGNTTGTNMTVDPWMLTHLEIVPASEPIIDGPAQHDDASIRTDPTIIAVYTSYNQAINATEPGFLQHSMVRRWSVKDKQLKLHPRFNDMQGGRKESAGSIHQIMVEKLSDTEISGIVSSVQILDGGFLLAITTQDGKTEIWNCATWQRLKPELNITKITSIFETGFVLPVSAIPILHCISSNTGAVGSSSLDDRLQCSAVQYQGLDQQPQSTKLNVVASDPAQEAAVASYALALSRSCWSGSNSDDVLSSIHANLTPTSLPIIVQQLYKTLFKPNEFISERSIGSELDKIAQKPLAGKVLSFHHSLHKTFPYKGTAPREASITRLWAWISLNLRHTTTVLYVFHQTISPPRQQPNGPPQPPPPPPNLPPSYVQMLCNDVRWAFSIFAFIFQTILEVGDRKTNPDMFDPPNFETSLGDEKGDGTQGLVALLMNCSWSRIFLVTMGKIMRVFLSKAGSMSSAMMPGTPLGQIVSTIQQCVEALGISINAIELLVDARWHPDTPSGAGKQGNQQQQPQQLASPETPDIITERQIKMMSTGIIPEVYQGTIQRILTNCINSENGLRKRKEIDRLKLTQESPDRSWFLLNMDDITFACHTPITTPGTALNVELDVQDSKSSSANEAPNTKSKPGRKLWDVHKKQAITFHIASSSNSTTNSGEVVAGRGTGTGHLPLSKQFVRRCIRCGSLSGDVNGIDRTWPRSMASFMARCVCDGHWLVEEFGEV